MSGQDINGRWATHVTAKRLFTYVVTCPFCGVHSYREELLPGYKYVCFGCDELNLVTTVEYDNGAIAHLAERKQ
jgi:hypothetical protein